MRQVPVADMLIEEEVEISVRDTGRNRRYPASQHLRF
jgi:hypothetical protein